jgi:hypothetical protein
MRERVPAGQGRGRQTVIADLAKTRPNKHLVFVTIIPRYMIYLPGQFSQFDVLKANPV